LEPEEGGLTDDSDKRVARVYAEKAVFGLDKRPSIWLRVSKR